MDVISKSPSDTSSRRTASVGAKELNVLRERWARYCAVSEQNRRHFDPVASLRSAGDLVRAVSGVIATADENLPPDTP